MAFLKNKLIIVHQIKIEKINLQKRINRLNKETIKTSGQKNYVATILMFVGRIKSFIFNLQY